MEISNTEIERLIKWIENLKLDSEDYMPSDLRWIDERNDVIDEILYEVEKTFKGKQ